MAGASEQGPSDRRVPTPPSADPEVEGPPTGPARRAKWPWWLALAALAAGGWFWYGRGGAEARAGSGAGGAAKAGAARPVPVVAATARKGDLALHLTGLGSVAPFHTVVVRSRVDGVLDTVSFVEGSLV